MSSAGHVITDRQVIDGCQFITVAGLGSAEGLAEEKTSDLALIRVYGVPDLAPIVFAGEQPKGNAITLVGIADPQAQAGGNAVTTVLARLGGQPDGAVRSIEPAPATWLFRSGRDRRAGPTSRHGGAQGAGGGLCAGGGDQKVP